MKIKIISSQIIGVLIVALLMCAQASAQTKTVNLNIDLNDEIDEKQNQEAYGPITPQNPDPIFGLMNVKQFRDFNLRIAPDIATFIVGGGVAPGDYTVNPNLSFDFVANRPWSGTDNTKICSALTSILVGNTFGLVPPGVPMIDMRIFDQEYEVANAANFINAMKRIDSSISPSNGFRVGLVILAFSTNQFTQPMIDSMRLLSGKAVLLASNERLVLPSELRSSFDNMTLTRSRTRQNQVIGRNITNADVDAYGERVQFNSAGQTVTGNDTGAMPVGATILEMLSGNRFLPLHLVNDLISQKAIEGLLNGYGAYEAALKFSNPPTPVTKLEILGPSSGVLNQGLTYNCGTLLPANARFEWRVKPVSRSDEGDLVSRDPVLRDIGFAITGDFLIHLRVFDVNGNLFGIGEKVVSITNPAEPAKPVIHGTHEVITDEGEAYEVVGLGFAPESAIWTIDGVIKANGQRFDPAFFSNNGNNFSQVHLLKVTVRELHSGQQVSADLLVTAHIRDTPTPVKAIAIDRSRLGKENRLRFEATTSRPDTASLSVIAIDLATGQEFVLLHKPEKGRNSYELIIKKFALPPPRQVYFVVRTQSGFTIGISFIKEVDIRVK